MKTSSHSSSMMKRPAQAGFALALLAALSMLLSGCGKEQDAHAAPAAGAPPAPPVSVAEVLSRAVAEQREFSGLIEAIDRAELRPRVSGYIDSVNLKPGTLVKKGDVLFVIDPRPYRAELARAEAAVAGSQARAELAKTEQERSKKLLADNAIAQRDYDERTANQRQLDAAARADQAALQTARLNLEWTTIRAPFDGRVGKAEVTVGNLVDGNTVLTSVVSANPMYVSFNGDEATYLQLGKQARGNPSGMKLHIGLANEKGFPHEGKLEFVDNRIDPAAGSVRMRGLIDNKDGLLTPGLFARVQVGTASPTGEQSALVAERAIGTDQNRKFVYVVTDKNITEYRPIQLGSQVGSLRVVSAGLKAGERIVVDGLQRVRPGAPVAPQVVPMDGPAGGASGAAASAQK